MRQIRPSLVSDSTLSITRVDCSSPVGCCMPTLDRQRTPQVALSVENEKLQRGKYYGTRALLGNLRHLMERCRRSQIAQSGRRPPRNVIKAVIRRRWLSHMHAGKVGRNGLRFASSLLDETVDEKKKPLACGCGPTTVAFRGSVWLKSCESGGESIDAATTAFRSVVAGRRELGKVERGGGR
jgi:hypothetical protein